VAKVHPRRRLHALLIKHHAYIPHLRLRIASNAEPTRPRTARQQLVQLHAFTYSEPLHLLIAVFARAHVYSARGVHFACCFTLVIALSHSLAAIRMPDAALILLGSFLRVSDRARKGCLALAKPTRDDQSRLKYTTSTCSSDTIVFHMLMEAGDLVFNSEAYPHHLCPVGDVVRLSVVQFICISSQLPGV